MAERQEKVEGVKVEKTGQKQWEKDYRPGDVEVLFRRGEWHNWDEPIRWLEQNGENDNELTPGEAIAMKEDLSKLKQRGEPFTKDPHKVFEMAHQHRG